MTTDVMAPAGEASPLTPFKEIGFLAQRESVGMTCRMSQVRSLQNPPVLPEAFRFRSINVRD